MFASISVVLLTVFKGNKNTAIESFQQEALWHAISGALVRISSGPCILIRFISF
jgi:hypothetical protein